MEDTARETTLEYETTNPSKQQSSSSGLLDQGVDNSMSSNSDQCISRVREFLRSFRLQPLFSFYDRFKHSTIERPKVALHGKRWLAVAKSLLHIVPLAGAITLLALQYTQYWIDYDGFDTTGLQFVAKVHELLMQASIVDVLLCLVRTEAIRGSVPLGAISGALQATQLSYLWSLDFLSLFTSTAIRGWRRALFVCAIPALLILTALVGPSSAVLMIPRPGSAHLDSTWTRYINTSVEDLFPSAVDSSHGLYWDASRFNDTLDAEQDNSGSDRTPIPNTIAAQPVRWISYLNKGDDYNSRLLRHSSKRDGMGHMTSSDGQNLTFWYSQANATIPTRFITESYLHITPRGIVPALRLKGDRAIRILQNGTIDVDAPYPVVKVKCMGHYEQKDANSSISYWQDDRSSTGLLSSLGALVDQAAESSALSDYGDVSVQYFSPLWIPSPEPGSRSTIAVLMSYVFSPNATEPAPSPRWLLTRNVTDFYVVTCTVSSYWNTAEVQQVQDLHKRVVQTDLDSLWTPRDERPIAVNLTDVDTLQGPNFHRLLAEWGGSEPNGMLACIMATVLADVPHWNTTLDWHAAPNSDATNSVAFKFTVTMFGWGYSITSTSIRLAVVVMMAYCVVSVAYIAYILITGSTSTAWNSAIEFIALALQSRQPDHLAYISVGIDNLETMKKGVGIRVNCEDRLEMVFTQDPGFGTDRLRKVRRDQKY